MTIQSLSVYRLVQLHIKSNTPLEEVVKHRAVLQTATAWVKRRNLNNKGQVHIDDVHLQYERSVTCEGDHCLDRVVVRFPDYRLWPTGRTLWVETPTTNFAINGHFYP